MKLIEKIAYYGFAIILFSIFMGAILYSADQMVGLTSTKEVLFWSALILIFILQINKIISGIMETTQSKSNRKRK
ncbi:hypothetical protein LCGC14_2943660 [marine sediment metagenome]|uniref:Uncharacterized protein n=1 Tax=marine sediment metagenome TaxID=412755 RepID=A0A0F8XHU1_9ZZZZ